MTEIWKPVPGYKEWYEVSNHGRVRSWHSNDHRTENRRATEPRILSEGKSGKGYTKVVLCIPGQKKKGHLVHWLVAAAFISPRPEGYDINHKNGIKDDNRPENLEYVTRQENIRHKHHVLGKGRGSNAWRAKLTEEEVLEIVRLSKGGMTDREIGVKFGVTQHAVWRIVHGRNWSWLTGITGKPERRIGKLSKEEVLKAVELIEDGLSDKEIGETLGVDLGTIRHIRVGNTWSWLTGIKSA